MKAVSLRILLVCGACDCVDSLCVEHALGVGAARLGTVRINYPFTSDHPPYAMSTHASLQGLALVYPSSGLILSAGATRVALFALERPPCVIFVDITKTGIMIKYLVVITTNRNRMH